MSRHLDLRSDTIWIHFPYDREVVDVVRAIPESSFQASEKAWTVPVRHLTVVVSRLEAYRFKFTPAFRASWESDDSDNAVEEADGWTVSQINSRVKGAIEGAFGESIWVVGELQGFDKNGKSGAAFFELVERPRPNADPTAKVRCICFLATRRRIADKLRGGPDISFRDGLKVRILARPDLHFASGSYQLRMEDIDPYFTAGELQRRREEVVAAMKRRGIDRQNVDLAWPRLPLRIALITSASGDARRDFEAELRQSGYAFELEIFEAAMQGERTESTVVEAFRAIGQRADHFDVVCLVRGGGARSDLAWFDTEPIAESVCECPVKVVVGVGHQRDRCALDELAMSAKTPTAAARHVVERVAMAEDELNSAAEKLIELATRRVEDARHRWRETAFGVSIAAPRRLRKSAQRLENVRESVVDCARRRVRGSRSEVERIDERLGSRSRTELQRATNRLHYVRQGLDGERLRRHLAGKSRDLDRAADRLERATTNVLRESDRTLTSLERATRLVHPDRVVERGFAIVRIGDRVVTDVAGLTSGDRARVSMRDGELDVEIISTKRSEDEG